MSRYNELSTLASNYSKQFHDHYNGCRTTAAKLILGYATYLDCPTEKIKQVELDGRLLPTDKTTSLSDRVKNVVDPEGFVHFAWRITFELPAAQHAVQELVSFGLRMNGRAVVVREESDFTVGADDEASWEPLFTYLYGQSRSALQTEHGKPAKRIGFINE